MAVLKCEIKFYCLTSEGKRLFGRKSFLFTTKRRAQDAVAITNACAHGRLLAAETWDVPYDHINVTAFSLVEN